MPLRFADPAPEAYRFPLLIGHLLDASMISAADQEIVYRDRVRLTYRQLRVRIGRLASALAALGVEQGTTVAVMDWDSHRYLESYFAVPMMGAVLMTANVRLPPAQLGYTLRHADAQVVLCHSDFYPLIQALLPHLPRVRAVIAIDDDVGTPIPPFATGEYEDMLAKADPDYTFEDFDENAVATTFYTSGTTGDPKGVCFSHRQIVLLTLASKGPFGVTHAPGFGIDDVYMPLTPMFHVHAWAAPYLATLMGVKQVYPGRYDPATICRLRQTEKVTYSHCVPTILQMVLAGADKTGTDLTGWTMTIGGAALTQALLDEARQHGMYIHAGYGMSETGPTVAMARRGAGLPEDAESEAASLTMAGVPIPLVSVRIVGPDGRDLPHDGQSRGELLVRAPWLTPCYVGNSEASEALWQGGWLHTQDVATIDAEGRVAIVDRLKDVIKTGGEWISSLDLENVIAGAEGVAEVAVIGAPDARWGERPVALVVPQPDTHPTLEAINMRIDDAIAAGTLSRYARLDGFELLKELPHTSVGKVDKKLLRTQLAAHREPTAA
jgi:fatty-acyl-CoA synthase